MFYNRINELEKLNEEYYKKGSSFSIVYGRRRVGKTALIGEFIKDKPHIYPDFKPNHSKQSHITIN